MNVTHASSVAVERSFAQAEQAVAGLAEYSMLRSQGEELAWVAYAPETGRNRIWRATPHGPEALTPHAQSVRSRVYEYGGGAWAWVGEDLAWVDAEDQQIWLTRWKNRTTPEHRRLTSTLALRFADLVYDAQRNCLWAVAENRGAQQAQAESSQQEPRHQLVSICLQTGLVRVAQQGADFYVGLSLATDGSGLAWIEWSHPHQPWLETRIAYWELASSPAAEVEYLTPEYPSAAWLQPRFLRDGRLLALGDPHNWWNLYQLQPGQTPQAIHPHLTQELTTPPWVMGLVSYLELPDGDLLVVAQDQGVSQLRRWCFQDATWQVYDLPCSLIQSLVWHQGRVCFIAQSAEAFAGILTLDLETGAVHFLVGGERPAAPVSLPKGLQVPRNTSLPQTHHPGLETIPAFFYPPQPGIWPPGQRPPLLVLSHGGPTSTTYPVLNPRIQFWTHQGFAVVDVNYLGSCGYGRDYRLALAGRWGEAEVADIETVADWLSEQGWVDPQRLCLRGQSAGGYTTLMAMARSQRWCAGASLYGVTDLLQLAQTTHKFESRYLDWLIAPLSSKQNESAMSLYHARSPLNWVENWQTPVIFFQGCEDAVVPAAQTRALVQALQEKGVKVAAHYFAGEGHGFRQAEHQVAVLEQELAFYRSCFADSK
ncbi:alpha/beta hydrolase family protein [Nitrincola tapanii]|uniref:S9 family peptidase n=1 Tax=Nitrincola tapanii TaxID=1708751 RepID=A0A5A9W6S2_9GAMM|nr:S9 family peptidase [Nitrincola tapanii]KAA0876392.1 S9 family peptidase [Nitrincola tapanii]